MDISEILFIPDGGKSGSSIKECQTSSQESNRGYSSNDDNEFY